MRIGFATTYVGLRELISPSLLGVQSISPQPIHRERNISSELKHPTWGEFVADGETNGANTVFVPSWIDTNDDHQTLDFTVGKYFWRTTNEHLSSLRCHIMSTNVR